MERILVDKMNYMAERYGEDVYFLTSDQGSHPITYHLSDRVHYEDFGICFYQQYRFHGLRRLMVAWKMNRQYRHLLGERLQIIQPDLIVCTTADKIGVIGKLKGNTPLVVESHSICIRTLDHGRTWLQRKLYRHHFLNSLLKADYVVALTEGDAKEWRKYHSKVTVIPNFIHPHEEHISDCSSKKAIFVGRFDYQKRAQDAIRIWKKVRECHPDWTLDIYGDGDMYQEVCSLASSVDGVVIHQPISQIFRAYQECSFLISTSLFEPFGLVLPEAMSCGLPVVAFDCPYGPADIISNGKDGFLIQNRNEEEFAHKLCLLMENESLRVRLGKAAILSAQHFSLEKILPMWKQLFQEVAKKTSCKELS
jgi:glycosyltransferase involved in cell wall biosynthesis